MTDDTRQPASIGRLKASAIAVWHVIRDFLVFVLVEPVRDGRLRAHRWPRGLAPVVTVALVGYGLAVIAILAAAPMRAASDLTISAGVIDLSLPQIVVGPVLALVVVALALAQTAALHAPLWLAIVVTFMTSLVLLSIGANDFDGTSVLSVGRVVSAAAALCLVILVALRRRRSYAWGEFVATFAIMAIGIGTPAWIVGRRTWQFGLDTGPVVLTSTMQSIGALAIPAALAAGAAVAQLSCSMATRSVESVRRNLPVGVTAALVVGLVVWRVWAVVVDLAEGASPVALIAAVALLALVVGGWTVVHRLRGRAQSATAAELESGFSSIAQPIAAWLTIGVVPSTALLMLSGIAYVYSFANGPASVFTAISDVISQQWVIWGSRLAVGAVLIVLAVRDSRRGRAVTPELYVAIGIVVVVASVLSLAGVERWAWTGQSLTIVVTVAATALLIWWAIRRRLSVGRGAALAMVLLIAALFDQRTFVEDPLRAVFGFTGMVFILFGFIWAMLTSGERANGTSRRYPRATRVLFFLANALFGVTVLAVAALARDPEATVDLSTLTDLGEQLLGAGLLAAALLACLALAVAASPDPATAVPASIDPPTTQVPEAPMARDAAPSP